MPPIIGLDIGSSAVRAAQVHVRGRGVSTLERFGQVVLPPDAVRDGEIVDGDAVTQALVALWDRYGFTSRKVALGLANQQVVVRQVDLPYLPEAELRKSLPLQAQEFIPIPVEQAILDAHLLGTHETEQGRVSRILLVAAQRTMVEAATNCVRAAKLTPVMVDLDAFAILRSVARQQPLTEPAGQMLLDIGRAVTKIVVHDNGIPTFVRTLLMGGEEITDTLAAALGISQEEAEHIKVSAGMALNASLPVDDKAVGVITEPASRFVEEIRGSLDYYAGLDDAVPVGSVVLSGGAAQLPNLAERLAVALDLPVDRGHPMQELRIGKVDHDQLLQAEPYLAVAVGLALGAGRA